MQQGRPHGVFVVFVDMGVVEAEQKVQEGARDIAIFHALAQRLTELKGFLVFVPTDGHTESGDAIAPHRRKRGRKRCLPHLFVRRHWAVRPSIPLSTTDTAESTNP